MVCIFIFHCVTVQAENRKRNVLDDDDDDVVLCVSPRSDKELAVSYPDLLLTDLKYKISNDNFSY